MDGTIIGPIVGALILEPAQQYFTLQYGQNGYYLIVYGALFLVIMFLLPRGIIPTLSDRWYTYQSRRPSRQQKDGIITTPLPTDNELVGTVKKEGINL